MSHELPAAVKKPSKKILLISDNQELTLFFQKEIASISFQHPIQIDYRYSSNNKNPEPMKSVFSSEINIKNIDIVNKIIKEYDLVISLHCKQIFPKLLVENVCCINFHPGFNPYNRGWFPQAFSIVNGLPAGATIHLIDTEIDHGNIIDQQTVPVEASDTSLDVYGRIIEEEKTLIRKNLFDIIEGNFVTFEPTESGNYNDIWDYRKLCKLDLSNVDTLKSHIDLLRATTHAPFKNAYFFDEDGNKYFIRISIERE